jgi:hypothetical protein
LQRSARVWKFLLRALIIVVVLAIALRHRAGSGSPPDRKPACRERSGVITAEVGIDNQTPVAERIGIGPETRFTRTINKITT